MNIPLNTSSLIDANRLTVGPNFATIPQKDLLAKIYRWMLEKYIMPQIISRRPYERIWDMLYNAYRMKLKIKDLKLRADEKSFVEQLIERQENTNSGNVVLADTLIFDTVDRLTNLLHFVMWKDGSPVQFNKPRYQQTPKEDTFYHPTENKYAAGNAIFEWNQKNQDTYRKTRIQARNWFLYGFGFALSDITYGLNIDQAQQLTLTDFGVTYEPISIKKVWLNYLLPISKMELQPCPFFFEYSSDAAVLSNQYDPVTRPFGFANLQEVQKNVGLAFMSIGEEEWKKGLQERLADWGQAIAEINSRMPMARALWTFYPQLPFDPTTGEFEVRKDGSPVPYKRFVWQHYGKDLTDGSMTPMRLQELTFYRQLPIYGSCHIEDLDSGAYPLSICEALMDYYVELTTMVNQYVENKNQINYPATWHVQGSPSFNMDVNRSDAKIPVLGPNDFGWKQTPDATQTTVSMCEHIRDRAQTTGKAVDAILGKAMGSRTTATEAENAFQTSMSGITTDINIFNNDFMGGFANRTWDTATRFFDPDLVALIAGQSGLCLTKDDIQLSVSLKTDVGSTYIESIVKQQHYRYVMESPAMMIPGLFDMRKLWEEFSREIKMPSIMAALIPDGLQSMIQKANEQAINTYLDKPFFIDPSQDHGIAVQVKIKYLEDEKSAWNIDYGSLPYQNTGMSRAQVIAQQIQIHNNFLMVQLKMQQEMQLSNMQMQMDMQSQQNQQQHEMKMEQQAQRGLSKNSGDAHKSTNRKSNEG